MFIVFPDTGELIICYYCAFNSAHVSTVLTHFFYKDNKFSVKKILYHTS